MFIDIKALEDTCKKYETMSFSPKPENAVRFYLHFKHICNGSQYIFTHRYYVDVYPYHIHCQGEIGSQSISGIKDEQTLIDSLNSYIEDIRTALKIKYKSEVAVTDYKFIRDNTCNEYRSYNVEQLAQIILHCMNIRIPIQSFSVFLCCL